MASQNTLANIVMLYSGLMNAIKQCQDAIAINQYIQTAVKMAKSKYQSTGNPHLISMI